MIFLIINHIYYNKYKLCISDVLVINMVKYCPECGNKVIEGNKFCPECGSSLNLQLKDDETEVEIKNKTVNEVEVEEKIVKRAEISKAIYIIPLVIGILTLVIFIGIFFILLAIVLFINASGAELIITNKHLIGKTGVISSNKMQIPLNMINTVSYEKGVFGNMFGYGTIKITSQMEDCVFDNVKDVELFQKTLLNEIQKFDDNKMIKQSKFISEALN